MADSRGLQRLPAHVDPGRGSGADLRRARSRTTAPRRRCRRGRGPPRRRSSGHLPVPAVHPLGAGGRGVSDASSFRSRRGLVGVLSASAAALSANRLLSIALPWFVLTTTGSATKTGLVVFC